MSKARTFGTTVGLAAAFGAAPVLAQEQPSAATPAQEQSAQEQAPATAETNRAAGIEDVVVTARRRQERLIETPITVTALSAARIDERGIQDFRQLSNFTPGVVINNSATQNSRISSTIIFRGMTPPTAGLGTNASVFIDGAPVSSGLVEMVQDAARVEVLKGPQTAYFGRSTFSGAINFVAKQPGNELLGTGDFQIGTKGLFESRLSFESPIIKDVLSVRVAGRFFSKQGTYRNSAGGRFGDQQTQAASVAISFTPSDNFRANFFGFFDLNDDGPSYQTKVGAPNYNCNAGSGGANNYICGTVPVFGALPVGANPEPTEPFRRLILNNTAGTLRPLFGDKFLNRAGSARRATHGHLNLEFDAGFATFTSLSAFNTNRALLISDLDGEDTRALPRVGTNPNAPPFNNFLTLTENYFDDIFQELRVTSPRDTRLRAMLGGSYFRSETAFYFTGLAPAGIALPFGTGAITLTRTPAVFGSLEFDIVPRLTVALEGRYQEDRVTAFNRTTFRNRGAQVPGADATFKDFTPRAILQYRPVDGTMIYASYSEGANPGVFNTNIATAPPALQALASAAGAGSVVDPETLKNYELGVKSQFWDNRAQLTVAVYRADWTDQIIAQQFGPLAGSPVILSVNNNIGKTRLQGVEVEGELRPVESISLNALVAYNDSNIREYVCLSCIPFTGPNFSVIGNQLPRSPKFSAAVGGQFRTPLNDDLDVFARADYTHKGPQFADETNLAKSKPQNLVSVRAGLANEIGRVEFFVTNLFNNTGPVSIVRNTDAVRGGQAFYQGLQERRRIGVRLSYRFGQ